jgi:hypothetical protein
MLCLHSRNHTLIGDHNHASLVLAQLPAQAGSGSGLSDEQLREDVRLFDGVVERVVRVHPFRAQRRREAALPARETASMALADTWISCRATTPDLYFSVDIDAVRRSCGMTPGVRRTGG